MHLRTQPNARLWGRSKGHPLSPVRRQRFEAHYPHFAIAPGRDRLPDASRLFDRPKRGIWLEIGFGAGEHLLEQAIAHPECGLIGCEPFENGIARAVVLGAELELSNLRLYHGDARHVIDWLPPASLGRVFLLYPDPWPKRRHLKRRFVSADNLDALAHVMEPGAELRFASDIPGYVAWTRQHVAAHPAFSLATPPGDEGRPWPGWPSTRYEVKALREGRTPTYLTIVRA